MLLSVFQKGFHHYGKVLTRAQQKFCLADIVKYAPPVKMNTFLQNRIHKKEANLEMVSSHTWSYRAAPLLIILSVVSAAHAAGQMVVRSQMVSLL